MLFKINIYIISLSFFLIECDIANEKKSSSNKENNTVRVQKKTINTQSNQEDNKKKKAKIDSSGTDILLNDKNAIPFFSIMKKIIQKIKFEYQLDLAILILNYLKTHHIIGQILFI